MPTVCDSLKDVVKHTLPFFEMVKIYNEEGITKFESINDTGSLVLINGELNTSIPELDDTSVGLSRLNILRRIVDFEQFSGEASTNVIKIRDGATRYPEEITFKSGAGHKATYRFTAPHLVDGKVVVPDFNEPKWDVEYTPTMDSTKDLVYFSGILGALETEFTPSVSNGKLLFNIGIDGTDRSVLPVAEVSGHLNNGMIWKLGDFLSLMRLSNDAISKVKISNSRAISVSIDSGIASYEFIIPARG